MTKQNNEGAYCDSARAAYWDDITADTLRRDALPAWWRPYVWHLMSVEAIYGRACMPVIRPWGLA